MTPIAGATNINREFALLPVSFSRSPVSLEGDKVLFMKGHADEFCADGKFRRWGEAGLKTFTTEDDFLDTIGIQHDLNVCIAVDNGDSCLLRRRQHVDVNFAIRACPKLQFQTERRC